MPKERLDISIILKAEKAAKEMKAFADSMKRNSNRAAKSVTAINNRLTRMRKNLLSMRTLMAGGIGVVAVKKLSDSFIEANDTAEKLQITLNSLLGSQEEGARLFEEMAKFAAKVPFEFEAIMKSATVLAGVLEGGVDEITNTIPLIADLAAAFGLTMEETTGQVQKMFSAGAGAADLFREKGILAMLGLQDGIKRSAAETKRILFEAWESEDSKFRGVADSLSDTWTGTVSMIADKWGQLMRRLGDLGLFQLMKDKLQEFDKAFGIFLDQNDAFFAERIPIWVKNIETFGSTVFRWAVNVKNVIVTIVNTYNSLPEVVREWGIILAIVGGAKIRIALATLTALGTKFDWVAKRMKGFANFFEGIFKTFTGEINFTDLIKMDDAELDKTLQGLKNTEEAVKNQTEAAKKAKEEYQKLFTLPEDPAFKKFKDADFEILPDPDNIEEELEETFEMYVDWADVIYQTNLKLSTRIKTLEAKTLSVRQQLLGEFGTSLTGVLSEGLQEWGGFFNSVLQGFKRMLAQMAAEMAAKSAIFGVLNAITGGGFSGIVGGFKKFLGFASGGFTGTGGSNDVAGVVHKNEFVVPQSMLQQNAGMLQALQGMQSGGSSNSTTFNVNLSGSFGEGMTESRMREMTRNIIIPQLKEAERSGLIGGIK